MSVPAVSAITVSSPFTATTMDASDASSIASVFSAMSTKFDLTRSGTQATSSVSSNTIVEASSSITSGSSISKTTPTTLITSSTATSSITSRTSAAAASSVASTTTSAAASTSAGAASNSDSNPLTQQQLCHGISCSPGLQAAIAVPVVVGVLGIVAIIFFCLRRRKRGPVTEEATMKRSDSTKKWTRHLRVFSFDAELLMGGRFSSTNSVRSRRTGSLRSGASSAHVAQSSVHSIDEVAPPYRDAISHAHPPNMTQTGADPVFAAGAVADPFPRPDSSATAPPPYGAARSVRTQTPTTPTSRNDPFSDARAERPVDDSPFNDPPDGDSITSTPVISRNSSMYHGVHPDDLSTLGGASEAGSIREAQVGRNVSVTSGGRTIENVRRSS